jgi:hypothetical protein
MIQQPDLNKLAMAEADVQALDKDERLARMHALLEESHALLDWGIESMITGEGKSVAGIAVLYSGGNDSTCLAHMFRELEVEVAAAGHPAKICKWGWGATEKLTPEDMKSGPLCSSCEYRQEVTESEAPRQKFPIYNVARFYDWDIPPFDGNQQ